MSKNRVFKTHFLGDLNIDVIMNVNQFPLPGNECLAQDMHTFIGGSALNAAIVYAKLGNSAQMMGALGDDHWGNMIREGLQSTTVDLEFVPEITNRPTGINFIPVTADGERTMFGNRGANTSFSPEDIPENALDDADLVHISGYALNSSRQGDAARKLIRMARENDIPLSLDTNYEIAVHKPEEVKNLLPHLTICSMGIREAQAIFQIEDIDSLEKEIRLLVNELFAVKMGSNGSLLITPQESRHIPAFSMDVIDSTGAGDTFCAGLIYAWQSNLSLVAAGILSNLLGAIAATIQGAGLQLPGKSALLENMFMIEQSQLSNAMGISKEIKSKLGLSEDI